MAYQAIPYPQVASPSRRDLVSIKRNLLSARASVEEAATRVRRAGDTDSSERLRGIVERVAD
jgi:hypothetical protein